MEFKQRIGYLQAALPGEHVHGIPGHGHGEIAAGGRTIALLVHLLPLMVLARQVKRPHIIQPGIPIVACIYPHLVVVDSGTMGRSRDWLTAGELPFHPHGALELVLEQIVLVSQIRVGVNVAGVAAEDEHRAAGHHSRVMVPRRRRCSSGTGPAPRLVFHTKADEVVQHVLAIVAAKHEHGILVGHHCVLASSAKEG